MRDLFRPQHLPILAALAGVVDVEHFRFTYIQAALVQYYGQLMTHDGVWVHVGKQHHRTTGHRIVDVAYVITPVGWAFVGVSNCAPTDTYSRHRGYGDSIQCALEALQDTNTGLRPVHVFRTDLRGIELRQWCEAHARTNVLPTVVVGRRNHVRTA